mmetsp:Transcript_5132/g.8309  ORF Transcript_5132/g.8309 Transcript_5132/m.8309 type:complete len:304 (+) Transcript_5132:83-994(+)
MHNSRHPGAQISHRLVDVECVHFCGHLSSEILLHGLSAIFRGKALGHKVSKLCDSGFCGHVAGADDAALTEGLAHGVLLEHDIARGALRACDHDDAGIDHFSEAFQKADLPSRSVATAIEHQHDALHAFALQQALEELVREAWDDPHNHDLCHVYLVNSEATSGWVAQPPAVDIDVSTQLCEVRVVGRLKGLKGSRVHLLAPIPSEKLAPEENTHFREVGQSCKNNGTKQILPGISERLRKRQLRSCQHHRLGQLLEHETQRRSCVGHRVSTMQHYETVVLIICLLNDASNLAPILRAHVCGV